MSNSITYVIGHKNPDTDSICSAIGLAEFKKAKGDEDVVPARAGDVNPQTAFILDYNNVEPPLFVSDVFIKAKDVMKEDVVSASSDEPLIKLMDKMRSSDIRFVPVLGEDGKPIGTVTLMGIAKRFSVKFVPEESRVLPTTLKNIIETINGEVVLDNFGSGERTLSLYIGAMATESFRDILSHSESETTAVIVGDRESIHLASIEEGVALVISTGGFKFTDKVIDEARDKGVSLIISPFDSATTSQLVRQSISADKVCDTEFETVGPDELIDDIKHKFEKDTCLIVVNEDGVMEGVITQSNILGKSDVKLILVDHNELGQAVDGAGDVEIVEVVDHHRLGNFHTAQPIIFQCDPVGSTSTLVAEKFRNHNVPITKETAGLLLGGVLSDTVILKSPTATPRDEAIIKWLEEQSGLDYEKYGSEIFAATSSIKKRGARAVVRGDHKVFTGKGGRPFGVGQVETVGFSEFYEEQANIEAELESIMNEKGILLSAVLVTDIVYGDSLLLAIGETKLMHNLGYPKVSDNVFDLKGVLSRKKQVVPHLLGVFDEVY